MNINFFMNKAIEEANKGLSKNEVPVGAILIDNEKHHIIAKAHNLCNLNKNAIHHAEILLINKSCKIKKSKILLNTSLFVTLEPCAMCAAAISEVRIQKIYFGAYDNKKGSLDSIMKIYNSKHYFVPEIYGGIEEIACASLLTNFFNNKKYK